jgi:thiol:disulfide interchange protein DsbD
MKLNHIPLGLLVTGSIFIILCIGIGCSSDKGETKNPTEDGIAWDSSIEKALLDAQQEQKLIMVKFTAEWCPSCRKMEDSTFTDTRIIQKAGRFIPIQIDVDTDQEIAEKYNGNAGKYGGVGIPNVLFLNPDGERVYHLIGYKDPEFFLAVMDSLLNGPK